MVLWVIAFVLAAAGAPVKKPAPAKKLAAAKKPPAALKAKPSKTTLKTVIKGKGQKKKKINLKFTVDCTHPVEDNIMDVASFVSFLFCFLACAFEP